MCDLSIDYLLGSIPDFDSFRYNEAIRSRKPILIEMLESYSWTLVHFSQKSSPIYDFKPYDEILISHLSLIVWNYYCRPGPGSNRSPASEKTLLNVVHGQWKVRCASNYDWENLAHAINLGQYTQFVVTKTNKSRTNLKTVVHESLEKWTRCLARTSTLYDDFAFNFQMHGWKLNFFVRTWNIWFLEHQEIMNQKDYFDLSLHWVFVWLINISKMSILVFRLAISFNILNLL